MSKLFVGYRRGASKHISLARGLAGPPLALRYVAHEDGISTEVGGVYPQTRIGERKKPEVPTFASTAVKVDAPCLNGREAAQKFF